MDIIKRYLKDTILYIFILLLWLISSFIFNCEESYYNLLKLPFFTLNSKSISILWFIVYILNSISIFIIIKKTNIFKKNDYIYILLTNYISNELFLFFFFYLMSPFLGFAITTIIFLSSIFLFIEPKKISKKAASFLLPYIIYNTYSFILITCVYFMNF